MKVTSSDKKKVFEILITPIIITIVGSFSTYFITHSQLKSSENISAAQVKSAENIAASNNQISEINLFKDLIIGTSAREKELAVRILYSIDQDLAIDIAYALSTNRSEDLIVAQTAYIIGKDINKLKFQKNIMTSFNIYLSDKNVEQAEIYLNDPFSGYSALIDSIYKVMNRKTLKGNSVPLDNINGYYLKLVKSNNPIVDEDFINVEKLKDAILFCWNEKNSNYRQEKFENIIR